MRNAAFRVGLLILGGIVLTVGFVWFFGGRTIRHGAVFESYFAESVQGLDVGSPVRYRGVSLGRITEIGLVFAEYGTADEARSEQSPFRQVYVRYQVDLAKLGRVPDVEGAIQMGLRARLASQGITGLSYLELDFVNPAGYPPQHLLWDPKYPWIPSMPSTLLQVQDAAQQVLAKLNSVDFAAVADSIAQLAQDLHGQIDTGDVHKTLIGAQDLLRTMRDAIQAADLPALSQEMRRAAGGIGDTAQSQDMRRLLSGGAQSAERLARAAAQLPGLIDALQTTVQRADTTIADVQRELQPLLSDLQVTAQNLRDITDAARQAPLPVLLAAPPSHHEQETK